MDTTLTILQYKEVLSAIQGKLGIDLSQYAMSSLRYNLVSFMKAYRINGSKELIKNINIKPNIGELLLSYVLKENVSLFREPSLWRIFNKNILEEILSKNTIKIWLPEIGNGSDLYTLLIILDHYNLRQKARITVSDISKINIERIRKGELSKDIISNSTLNLKHFDQNLSLNDYTYQKDKHYFINKDLLRNIFTIKSTLLQTKPIYTPNLVIFRNKMIYYNHVLEQKAINHLHKNMAGGGFLITGIKEDIGLFEIDKKFRLINKEEQIYKRNY